MDQRIEAHFNTLLDQVAEWRRNRTREEDVDLLSRIEDMHRDFPLENQQTFNQVGVNNHEEGPGGGGNYPACPRRNSRCSNFPRMKV